METLREAPGCQIHGVFKSYYVVWKQQPDSFLVADSFLFKSYYVVWKLYF